MKSLVDFIAEAKTFVRDDQHITYDTQINLKKDLAKDLGLKYTGKFKDMKKGPNIFFDGSSIYYSLENEDKSYDLEFGKSTYSEVKQAVIDMYKKHEDELKSIGWEIPKDI